MTNDCANGACVAVLPGDTEVVNELYRSAPNSVFYDDGADLGTGFEAYVGNETKQAFLNIANHWKNDITIAEACTL